MKILVDEAIEQSLISKLLLQQASLTLRLSRALAMSLRSNASRSVVCVETVDHLISMILNERKSTDLLKDSLTN